MAKTPRKSNKWAHPALPPFRPFVWRSHTERRQSNELTCYPSPRPPFPLPPVPGGGALRCHGKAEMGERCRSLEARLRVHERRLSAEVGRWKEEADRADEMSGRIEAAEGDRAAAVKRYVARRRGTGRGRGWRMSLLVYLPRVVSPKTTHPCRNSKETPLPITETLTMPSSRIAYPKAAPQIPRTTCCLINLRLRARSSGDVFVKFSRSAKKTLLLRACFHQMCT